jgi:hypothetical protein
MTSTIAALVASLGIALVITASTRQGTHAGAVVDSLGEAGGRLERASLGESGA